VNRIKETGDRGRLPGTFADAWDKAARGEFAEANTAHIETSHIAPISAAEGTAIIRLRSAVWFFTGREGFQAPFFQFLLSDFECFSRHDIIF